MQGYWNRGVRALAGAAGLVLVVAGAGAQEGEPVSLDQLLKLPRGTAVAPVEVEKRGGRTRSQWQDRYRSARRELAEAEESLADSRAALEERMGEESSSWKMAHWKRLSPASTRRFCFVLSISRPRRRASWL